MQFLKLVYLSKYLVVPGDLQNSQTDFEGTVDYVSIYMHATLHPYVTRFQTYNHLAYLIFRFHTNMPLSSRKISNVKLFLGSLFPSLTPYSERIYPLKKYISNIMRESGYFHIQATKPDTIGEALFTNKFGCSDIVVY